MVNMNCRHNTKKKNALLSKKLRDFNGLKFSKPSQIFQDIMWAKKIKDEYQEAPQEIIDYLQALIDDIGINGLADGIGKPRKYNNFRGKSKQKNKELTEKSFYVREITGGYRLLYDERIVEGKRLLYIISFIGHYNDH